MVAAYRSADAPPPPVLETNDHSEEEPSAPTDPTLRLATLNIMDGRRNRLNAALRCMRQMNVDVGVLTETKFHNDMFTKFADGYSVVGTTTTGNTGGVALIYRNSDGWGIESTKLFGKNVIRCTIVSGQRKWYLIGAYIPPSDDTGDTLGYLSEAYITLPSTRWPVIVVGDLNMDPLNPSGNNPAGLERRLETAALLSTWGMESLSDHFLSGSRRIGRRWTWSQVREGITIRSRCDHILTNQSRYCRNCQLKIPRYESDHLAVLSVLRLGPVKNHRRYVKRRSVYPIKPVLFPNGNRADALLAELQEAAALPERETCRSRSWITEATWQLIDRKASARKSGNMNEVRALKGLVQRALNCDRKARAEAAAVEAEAHLRNGDIHKAFGAIRGWYRQVGPRPSKPSLADVEETRKEQAALHASRPTLHDLIPVHIAPYDIDDGPPTEDEVATAVRGLKPGKAAGATGIKAEHLKGWLHEARPTENDVEPIPESVVLWVKVLELVRLVFVDGEIPKAFSESILVMIPKPEQGQFRGIALLEILYKVVSSIINVRLRAIELHDSLHGSVKKRGTGTAIIWRRSF